jgi:hypothetical protein
MDIFGKWWVECFLKVKMGILGYFLGSGGEMFFDRERGYFGVVFLAILGGLYYLLNIHRQLNKLTEKIYAENV